MASALEESQKQMNLAARAARLSMWIWDVARDRIWATTLSAATSRHAGRHADRVRGGPCRRCIRRIANELDRAVRKALATGEELDVEYR